MSVWLLTGSMTVLPLALFGCFVFGMGVEPEALCGGVLGVPVAAALLAGWRAGWWLAAFGTCQMALGCLGAVSAMIAGQGNVGGVMFAALLGNVTATLAALLWWPATRRWCGLLPADPYGEYDD